MNKNIIGISTASGHEFLPLERRFELFKKAGFKTVMLWWGYDEKETRKNRVNLAQKYGLNIENVHADMANSNSLWEHGFRGDEKVNEIITAIDDCRYLGIERMVVHLTNGYTPPDISDTGLRRLDKLLGHAIKNNVTLGLENVRTEKHLKYILDLYQDEHIGLCFDSGHANLWCKNIDWLDLYAHRLVAVHLHDNKGMEDSHDIPFSGNINWNKTIRQINDSPYKGSLTIETEYKGDQDESLVFNFLKKSFQSAIRLRQT